MKTVIIIFALFVLSTSLVKAESFLSRDFCNFDISTAMLHKGQIRSPLISNEKTALWTRLTQATSFECIAKVDLWKKAEKRKKPKKETCPFLPKSFWADSEGRTLYRMTERQIAKANNLILEDVNTKDCLGPLLDY